MVKQNYSSSSSENIFLWHGHLVQDVLSRRNILRLFLCGLGCVALSCYVFAANPQEGIVANLEACEKRIAALETALSLKDGKIQRLDVVNDINVGSISANAITVGKAASTAFHFGTHGAHPIVYGYYNGGSSHKILFEVNHETGEIKGECCR